MMNLLKKFFVLLMAAVFCLSLTACGGSDDAAGDDWRNSGEVVGSGTITRSGEDTFVLVCIHEEDASFYYDEEEQVLFDSVNYPITFESDPQEAFQSIDFADLNGDGNSDVTLKFNVGGDKLLMVWFWDAESEQFMYQPEESQLGEYDDGRGDLIPDDGDTGENMESNNAGNGSWSDPGDGSWSDPGEGRGDYVDEDGWGDYVDEDGWGDYVDEDGWGDYVDEDGWGDYVDEDGWGDSFD